MSDVHLSSLPNQRRQEFVTFLRGLNERVAKHPSQQRVLVLNGDILDVMASWREPTMPWEDSPLQVETSLRKVLGRILDTNPGAIRELRRFLASPNTRVYYVLGNHDDLLRRYPKTQGWLRAQLASDSSAARSLHFVPELDLPELGLHAAHGQAFDWLYNQTDEHPFALGDLVYGMLENRMLTKLFADLRRAGYSPATVHRLEEKLSTNSGLALPELSRRLKALALESGDPKLQALVDGSLRGAFDRESAQRIIGRLESELVSVPRPLRNAAVWLFTRFGSHSRVAKALSPLDIEHNRRQHAGAAAKAGGTNPPAIITYGHTHCPENGLVDQRFHPRPLELGKERAVGDSRPVFVNTGTFKREGPESKTVILSIRNDGELRYSLKRPDDYVPAQETGRSTRPPAG